MIVKKPHATSQKRAEIITKHDARGVDRRAFLLRSGLAVAGMTAFASLSAGLVEKAAGARGSKLTGTSEKKSVCTRCSVGCTLIAKIENDVWVGLEAGQDSPINQGSFCARGASVREQVNSERRLKYPLKLVDGKWQRLSWDTAMREIARKMESIRSKDGPDALYWAGSAHFSNEQAYLFRKLAAYWGTNNIDHQQRLCRSPFIAGVANMVGFGASMNPINDVGEARSILLVGTNPAVTHPVAMGHILTAKENGARLTVIDPRSTRSAAHASTHVQLISPD